MMTRHDVSIKKIFQVKTMYNYKGRELVHADDYTLQFHLSEEDFFYSEHTKNTVAYSTQVYYISEAEAEEVSKKYTNSCDKNITFHDILTSRNAPTAVNLIIDIDSDNHILDQKTLDNARKLNIGLASCSITEGSDYVIHFSGGGGFHFVFPYWIWSKFDEYSISDTSKIVEYICDKFNVLFDKSVYREGQILKAAFSYDHKGTKRLGNPDVSKFSYSITSRELMEWPLEKIIMCGHAPVYKPPSNLLPMTASSTKLKALIAESSIRPNSAKKTFAIREGESKAPNHDIIAKSDELKTDSARCEAAAGYRPAGRSNEAGHSENVDEPVLSSTKNDYKRSFSNVSFKCPVITNIFKFGRDSLRERWASGASQRWSDQLPLKTAIIYLQKEEGLADYYSELKTIFSPDRVDEWMKDPIDGYKPNCKAIHTLNFELTGMVNACNCKCPLYETMKAHKKRESEANPEKNKPAVYNKWSREYFESQSIYLYEQDYYRIDDNHAVKLEPEINEMIQNDFKLWLGDEYNDPKIIEKMKNNARLIPNLLKDKKYLAFSDKLLNLETFETEDYAGRIVFVRLPYRYAVSETGTIFEKYLEETLLYQTGNDTRERDKLNDLIDEILASAIAPEKFHKAFLFRGIPGTGKSVFLTIVRNLAGTENAGAVKLNQLCNDNYIIGLQHKSLNVADEKAKSSKGDMDETKIKDCIDGTPQSIWRKYKDNITLSLRCFFIFASNNKVNINDRWSVADRFIVIPFKRVFRGVETEVRTLPEIISDKDMPYILYRALRGLKRLRDNGGKYTIPEFVKRSTDMEFRQNSPVFEWAYEYMEWAEGDFTRAKGGTLKQSQITNDGAYFSYDNFCKQNGYKPLGYSNFKEELETEVMRKTIYTQHTREGNGYMNIRLRTEPMDKRGPSIVEMTFDEYLNVKRADENKYEKQLEL